jgi:AmmeMemoRadiSam system protein A
MVLNATEQRALLGLARHAIGYYLEHGAPPGPDARELGLSPALRENRAAFVTLTGASGMLRGCIGDILPSEPLYASVLKNAVHAAFSDPRFPPVRADELPALHIDISALSRPRAVPSPADIVLGRHGIILSKGFRRAVFLPQVAPEQGWDLGETLDHLALKAGLPPQGWRHGAEFQVFEAEVFGEEG